ncbi:carotenoid oxygenase family protein [Sphingorhabdus sp. Alg231-15]|uniref:carotenoid oxygenase family protein n=1 Tax=Sphingorhabdus sp. Alg231-15 TaxID=1922222 RepID=UPI00307B8809
MSVEALEKPWHLRGNWAPVLEEKAATGLVVEGEIPDNLNGTYIRTGPNPSSGQSVHWFFGDGLLHGIRLQDGNAEWYRSKYVETIGFGEDPLQAGHMGKWDHSKANTHIVSHNGEVLALNEGAWPYVIDQDLRTIGMQNYDGALTTAMTAHPKICPETGELLAFSYANFQAPFLQYIRVGADGELKQLEGIDIPQKVMMHDFAITRNYAIFLDLPVVFDFEMAMKGFPYEFRPNAGARLGVMPRNGNNGDVRWFEIAPCAIFHTVNAFEEGDKIVMIASRMGSWSHSDFSDVGYLWRWTIDLKTGQVTEEQLDDRPGDFGRVNEQFTGLPSRYGYLMEMDGEGNPEEPTYGKALLKYDLQSGACKSHELGASVRGGEPTFVQTGTDEDDGYAMTFVHDEATDQSSFVILDCKNFDAEPVATIRLPDRVPYGAHGNWIPLQ